MNNQELLNYINFIANKDQIGNTLSEDNYQSSLQVASQEYYDMLISKYEKDQKETESIRRFKVSQEVVILNTFGIGPLPANYRYPSRCQYRYIDGAIRKWKSVDIVTDDEFGERESSTIEFPSFKNPIVKIVANSLEARPKEIQRLHLSYLRKANVPTYVYTFDLNDNIIYDDALSVELDFEEIDKIKIAGIILSKVGINIRETQLIQYAELMKADK